MQTERRRVVITGAGTYNPLGNDVDTTWRAAAAGKSGIGSITHFDAGAFKTQIAGEVKDFDPVAHFGRKEARRFSRTTQLALAAAAQAVDEARLSATADYGRIGVIVGSGMGSLDPIVRGVETLATRGPQRLTPFFVPMMLADTPAATISIAHGFSGPNMAIATACATGNNAIGEAAAMLRRGAADVMLAGGTEACIIPLGIAGFSMMGALSERNDAPEAASRPFDKTRDGFVTSEGAAILVLETLEHAQQRGATIYGELLGYGTSADAYHITKPKEKGGGAVQAMRAALADANLSARQIDYINAHGTGTWLNDRTETAAIKTAFGSHAANVPISSTKSMLGHMLGAGGALEAILCLRMLAEQIVLPTINLEHSDPACDLDYVPHTARPLPLERVMSNAFGLGGHNATIILGRYT